MEPLKPAVAHGVNTQVRLMEYDQRYGRHLQTCPLLEGERPVKLQVYQSAELDGRSLLTDGLSDAPLGGRRFELVWYVSELLPLHVEWLRRLAEVAVREDMDLFERIFTLAPPAAPGVSAATVMTSPVPHDRDDGRFLVCPGPMWTYHVLPLSDGELAHLRRQGNFSSALSSLAKGRPLIWR
jgi:hypothetical protein